LWKSSLRVGEEEEAEEAGKRSRDSQEIEEEKE
jgi:hypothetical protein